MHRSSHRVLLGAWLSLASGCTASRQGVAPSDETPFDCATEPARLESRPVPIVNLPVGRLEIVCQPEAPPSPRAPREEAEPRPPTLEDRVLARRCRFIAQAVPLVEVAIALSAATGYDFTVQPEVMSLRVGVSLHDATLQEFVESLRADKGRARLAVNERRAHFYWQEGLADHFPCGPELGVLLVRIPPGVPRRQLASLVCHQLLSESGSVSLVGDRLLVKGDRVALQRVQTMIRTLDPARDPAEDARAPSSPGCSEPSE